MILAYIVLWSLASAPYVHPQQNARPASVINIASYLLLLLLIADGASFL